MIDEPLDSTPDEEMPEDGHPDAVQVSTEESSESPYDPVSPPAEDNKHWYVVKVQSGREETIKDAIEKRVKIDGLEEYYGQIVIPTENRPSSVRASAYIRERKLFPGYLMVNVEFNDRVLYLFCETPGVGDFVGGGLNKPPQPMSDREVERLINKQIQPDVKDKPQ